MRYRHVYMGLLTSLTLVLLFVTSPDTGVLKALPFGAGFIATIALLLKATLFIALLHISRKGLFDYIDLEDLTKKVLEGGPGALPAAVALLALVLAMFPIAFLIYVAQVT